jgi:formylglycine-generating enzyme required for sulfatase activity
MTDISHLFDNARSGNVSDRQFLGIIHRELRLGGFDAASLLSALRDERQSSGLSATLRRQAVEKVQSWSGRPAPPPEPESWGYEGSDTVIDPAGLQRALATKAPGATAWNSEAGTARVGRILNQRFQLIERIGSGGMSTVFKAVDKRRTESQSPDPYVAVKMLNLPDGDHAPALTLLQREAQKLQTLAHPNIVRVMDCDRDGALVFMTMEYLNGESLKHHLAANPKGLPRDEAMRTLAGIGAGLIHAHRNHLVHGDLKPANVILTTAGQVKVIDFGVARVVSQSQHPPGGPPPESAAEPAIAVTPMYASPEMLSNAPPDQRDDVYALACMSSELFSGVHPFAGRSSRDARAQNLKPTLGPGLTQRQSRAIRRALQFDREQRTPSVERFLAEFGLGLGVATGDGSSGGLMAAGAQRRAAAVIIGLLVLAGVMWWLFRHPSTTTQAPVASTITPAAAPSVAAPAAVSTTAPAVNAVFRDCPTCPLMKVLPPGQFQQGSVPRTAETVALEYPRHAVSIAAPFAVSVYDVTVAEYRESAEAAGHDADGCWSYDGSWREHADLNWRHAGFDQGPSHPVTCVSWNDAVAYAGWLSTRTGQHYRLPSASEWEYAAAAGTGEVRPWKSQPELACRSANVADASAMSQFPGWKTFACRDGYVHTSPVGSFAPNALGLYDTLGNVFQWTADCWHDSYNGAPADGAAWTAGDCSRHEVRGGSWFTDPAFVRTTYRSRFSADYRTNTVGFRLVRVIP